MHIILRIEYKGSDICIYLHIYNVTSIKKLSSEFCVLREHFLLELLEYVSYYCVICFSFIFMFPFIDGYLIVI